MQIFFFVIFFRSSEWWMIRSPIAASFFICNMYVLYVLFFLCLHFSPNYSQLIIILLSCSKKQKIAQAYSISSSFTFFPMPNKQKIIVNDSWIYELLVNLRKCKCIFEIFILFSCSISSSSSSLCCWRRKEKKENMWGDKCVHVLIAISQEIIFLWLN